MARARFLTRVQPRQERVEIANAREAVIRPAIGNRCGDGMPQVKLISSRSPSSLLRIIIRVTGSPQGATGTWANARERWIEQWFGFAPDFIITLDAIYSHPCGNAEFMALVVYGLYHAAQETAARPSSPAGRSSRGRQSSLVLFVATAQTRVAFNRPPESSTRISPMLVAPVSSNRRADHSPARTRCR
ncbi:putative metallopeptidase [Sinorhizobium meliloti]|uniref:putative metallopeptidase n=1 Tax=Rhizobium meliloti TaxID=382 RepID=UPI002D78713B|nr:putative metallopeptidase [Sinorhizobium meliloti]